MKISDSLATVAFLRVGKEKHTMILGIRTAGGTEPLTVRDGFYESVGAPRVGDILDEETVDLIYLEHQRREAMKIALRLLAFADNSERSLTEKLRRKGIPREIAEETVREVVRLGYLDEMRALAVLVRAAANGKLHGPLRVRAELAAKGYPQAKISRAISALCESGEVDFEENFRLLLEKKTDGHPSPEEIQKYKVKYGYKSC